jgi:hypothetical protein
MGQRACFPSGDDKLSSSLKFMHGIHRSCRQPMRYWSQLTACAMIVNHLPSITLAARTRTIAAGHLVRATQSCTLQQPLHAFWAAALPLGLAGCSIAALPHSLLHNTLVVALEDMLLGEASHAPLMSFVQPSLTHSVCVGHHTFVVCVCQHAHCWWWQISRCA